MAADKSSRAIIASVIRNGYFSSWCWANGNWSNAGDKLRKYFKTNEDVEELISYKSIFGIFNDPSEDHNKEIEGKFSQLQNGLYVKYDGGKDAVVSGGYIGFFPSLASMLNEDIQYIYIFDNGNWLVYKKES